MNSRQAQKSPPPARPRSARWNEWLCALTKPGRVRRSFTAHTILHGMAARAVPAPLAQLPNALTILRLALIPVFVGLIVAADEANWPAAIVFGVAGVTDQIDGFLARRWRVESAFGKIADPLADRLMIDAAAVILLVTGRLPWVASLVILVARRDPRRRLHGRRPPRLRVRGQPARQGRHLAALRLARLPHGHERRRRTGRSGSSGRASRSRSSRSWCTR